MPTQLDILALEPFHGGARKAMLDTLMRYSRHRWTLLRLPPRRIERRLAAAAHWFAEQLSRHWVAPVDVLFLSEAMNLADLVRMVPELGQKPRIVYFHDNQLPPAGERAEDPLHLVNLSTAAAATEIWFNSVYHLKTFLKKASGLIDRYPELSGLNPLPELTAKARLMPPPIDLKMQRDLMAQEAIERDPRLLFVDTRDANVPLLNEALGMLGRRAEKFSLVTVGPVEGLDEDLPRRTVSEGDEIGQLRALHQAAVLISARLHATADHHAVRALHAGCWPVFPDSGVYPELLPESLHPLCLYDGAAASRLAQQLQNVWWIHQPPTYKDELAVILKPFEAAAACQAIDERFEQLAIAQALSSEA